MTKRHNGAALFALGWISVSYTRNQNFYDFPLFSFTGHITNLKNNVFEKLLKKRKFFKGKESLFLGTFCLILFLALSIILDK